ncbi:hypothetical protein VDGL01_05731 [Verticillium dahliae]
MALGPARGVSRTKTTVCHQLRPSRSNGKTFAAKPVWLDWALELEHGAGTKQPPHALPGETTSGWTLDLGWFAPPAAVRHGFKRPQARATPEPPMDLDPDQNSLTNETGPSTLLGESNRPSPATPYSLTRWRILAPVASHPEPPPRFTEDVADAAAGVDANAHSTRAGASLLICGRTWTWNPTASSSCSEAPHRQPIIALELFPLALPCTPGLCSASLVVRSWYHGTAPTSFSAVIAQEKTVDGANPAFVDQHGDASLTTTPRSTLVHAQYCYARCCCYC